MRLEGGVYPPLACRPSPPQGGRSARLALPALSAAFEVAGRHPRVDLPTCGGDARQGRGGKPHPPTSSPKILPNQINLLPKTPQKTPEIPPQLSQWRANHPHTARVPPSDTPQGVAARRDRRWGWEGDANLSASGSGSDLPGGTGERRRRFRTGCRCLSDVLIGPACLCCKTPFRVLRLRSWRSGLSTTGCTDSSSSSGRTRPWGLKRKSGGTQEDAPSAPSGGSSEATGRT